MSSQISHTAVWLAFGNQTGDKHTYIFLNTQVCLSQYTHTLKINYFLIQYKKSRSSQ